MEIPRSLLDELSEEVNAISGAAQAQATIALNNLFAEWDGSDYDALRTAAIAILETILGTYTDLSAARAAESYDAMRAAQAVGGSYAAIADSRRRPGATQGALYAITKTLEQTQSADRFRAEVLDRVDTEVRRAANQCVAYNARRDPKKPRYARVPVGETCGFCLMLSSFGYQYTSEEAASHAHRHCNCRVVPSFGEAEVDGYDPDAMYERYNSCISAIGGRRGIRDEWNALPKAEREAYIAKHGGKAGSAFDAYVNKRMAEEISTRDPEWFTTGKIPPVTKERGAKPMPKERSACGMLSENGFSVEFLKERNRNGEKTADAKLCGVVWEFKIPEKWAGEYTVRNQFKKAAGKGTSKLLISCNENHAPADEVAEHVRTVFGGDDFSYIDEVLVLSDSGELTRIKRPKKK